jgi:hypothetical protein
MACGLKSKRMGECWMSGSEAMRDWSNSDLFLRLHHLLDSEYTKMVIASRRGGYLFYRSKAALTLAYDDIDSHTK